jgi:RHS repeat-associated protein
VSLLFNRIYEHDPNGNVISITDTVDPNWNQPPEKPETYTYETGTNRLSRVIGETPFTFGYDFNGNTTSTNNRTYIYDHSNQITSVLEDTIKIAEYVYNGAGQRIKKVTQDGIRIFHYDILGHLIAETNEKGETIAEYVYLGDQLLSMMDREGAIYYYHNDHLGTPQMLTDSIKGIVWKAGYSAFGETNILIEAVENPLRFPGQYYDKETGLHYNYFRYYGPRVGRYLTPDPIGLVGGINPFTYVANNPTNWMDPEGLAIYIKIPTRDEYEETLSSFGLGGLPDWLKDAMYEGYKNPDPADMMGGMGFGGRTVAKICRSGKFIQRAKEALGIFPTKIGGGGKLQPYSELTGRYVSETKTVANKIYGAVNSASVSFATGFSQGFASGYSGVNLPPAINKPQSWGQLIGNIVGSIAEEL